MNMANAAGPHESCLASKSTFVSSPASLGVVPPRPRTISSDADLIPDAKRTRIELPSQSDISVLGQKQTKHCSVSSSQKDRFVAGLVGASVLAIESIWGSPTFSSLSAETNALPLHWFVKEVLRRSRTSCSTLQVALYYLHKSRREIRDVVAKAERARLEVEILRNKSILSALAAAAEKEKEIAQDLTANNSSNSSEMMSNAYPSPPLSPVDSGDSFVASGVAALTILNHSTSEIADTSANYRQHLLDAQSNPILCGRRMFLAALISASKYLQDRNYSNRAWSRISGLPISEINLNERSFLNLIQFSLHLRSDDFRKCKFSTCCAAATKDYLIDSHGIGTERLSSLTAQGAIIESANSLSPYKQQAAMSLGLTRSTSEYCPDQEILHNLAAKATVSSQVLKKDLGRSRTAPPAENSVDLVRKLEELPVLQDVKVIRPIDALDLDHIDCGEQSKVRPGQQLLSPATSSSSEEDSASETVPLLSRKVRGLPHRHNSANCNPQQAEQNSSIEVTKSMSMEGVQDQDIASHCI